MIGQYIERKLFVEKAPQTSHYIGAVPYGERSGLVPKVYDQIMPIQIFVRVFEAKERKEKIPL